MKLLEVLDFPVADGRFELLNLTGPIDQDLLIEVLDSRDLMLTYNGVELKNLDKLMEPFTNQLHEYFHGDAPGHEGHESLHDTVGVYYDWDTMCIYLEEGYKVYSGKGSKATTGMRQVFERVCYTNTRKKNTIKFLTAHEYYSVISESKLDIELINLRKVVPGIP